MFIPVLLSSLKNQHNADTFVEAKLGLGSVRPGTGRGYGLSQVNAEQFKAVNLASWLPPSPYNKCREEARSPSPASQLASLFSTMHQVPVSFRITWSSQMQLFPHSSFLSTLFTPLHFPLSSRIRFFSFPLSNCFLYK